MTVTLKNVPPELHALLKARAQRHKRSLNQETLACLEEVLAQVRRDPAQVLAELREFRRQSAVPRVTTEWMLSAIEEGRA